MKPIDITTPYSAYNRQWQSKYVIVSGEESRFLQQMARPYATSAKTNRAFRKFRVAGEGACSRRVATAQENLYNYMLHMGLWYSTPYAMRL